MKVKTFVDVDDEKDNRIIKALEEIEWKPNFTELSKATGIPVTTLFDRWKTMQEKKGYDMKLTLTVRGEDKRYNDEEDEKNLKDEENPIDLEDAPI